MSDERNRHQIIRKDARGCFVESLNNSFDIGKIHLVFSSYDLSRPAGQRQTDIIHIYIAADEFLELCRKLTSGELRYILNEKRASGDKKPVYQSLGGTPAKRLVQLGRPRPDGMSLSRTMQLLGGSRSDILLTADSGPGEQNEKGLIVPRFGKTPENHVAVSMTFDAFSQLMLTTKAHYCAWLSAWYMRGSPKQVQENGYAGTVDLTGFGGYN